MVFSSLIFLFYFLPVVLLSYFCIPARFRNLHLLLTSLFFYGWGEGFYVLLMLGVITLNYLLGLSFGTGGLRRPWLLLIGIIANLMPLAIYKYGAFLCNNFDGLLRVLSVQPPAGLVNLPLPLGISFFTFQALSYLVDTYRETTPPQRNPVNLGLYIALFPQLIAGPIIRYHDLARQLARRQITLGGFSYGIERFICGLAKKVLLANTLGQMADTVFSLPPQDLNSGAVWLGAISYTLQIYYDFSGYSDMAIGLGHMFGFTFLENFKYPYISKSIQEFWRRWHISLSNWFRDYLYIPLGGNRRGALRTNCNLVIVFLLCGFWHGAAWNFVFWGIFHGFFLTVERGSFGRLLKKAPAIIAHGYTMFIVIIGWIFFRADNFGQGVKFVKILFGAGKGELPFQVILAMDPLFLITLAGGLFFALPTAAKLLSKTRENWPIVTSGCYRLWLLGLMLLSMASLATGAYNPFIYFRF